MSMKQWSIDDLPRLDGKTAVITGANSGLGLASTLHLARAGATVVMACRSPERAAGAADRVRSACPAADLHIRSLDLSNLGSVRAFASALTDEFAHPDILLNNAGVMAVDHGRTADGFETQFGTNHLGHFALTGLLLPALMSNPSGARIVNVSSMGHRAGRMNLDDPHFDQRRYQRWGAYFQSKLANLLFTAELHRRLAAAAAPVTALAAHPGSASTELGKVGSSASNWVLRKAFGAVMRGPETGAHAQVVAASAADVVGGTLIGPRWMIAGVPVQETPSKRARNESDARALWLLSERLTGVTYPV